MHTIPIMNRFATIIRYYPTLSIPVVFSKSTRSFRIIIPRQRSPIHCYYASTAPPFFTNSPLLPLLPLLLRLSREKSFRSFSSYIYYLTFSTNGEFSPFFSSSRFQVREGKPLLCSTSLLLSVASHRNGSVHACLKE